MHGYKPQKLPSRVSSRAGVSPRKLRSDGFNYFIRDYNYRVLEDLAKNLYQSRGTILYFYRHDRRFSSSTSEVIVLIKSAKTLTGVMLALAALGVSILPAQAQPTSVQKEILLSQLSGDQTYKKQNQLFLSNYAIGLVRGKVGNILFVQFLPYASFPGYVGSNKKITHIHLEGAAEPGDDVILRPAFDSNGNFKSWEMIDKDYITSIISTAFPRWITRLKYKEVAAVETSSINFESSAPVSLPPVERSAPASVAPAPAPAPSSVRGLW